MPSKVKKSVNFDEYKAIKDEIIEISEQRFENILTKRLVEFKRSLLGDLKPRFESIDARFDAINTKFDSKFDSMEKRLTFMTWFLPLFISILILSMKLFEK